MKLARVYREPPHFLERFCMYETVYRSQTMLIISVVSAKEFNTFYADDSRLIKKDSLCT